MQNLRIRAGARFAQRLLSSTNTPPQSSSAAAWKWVPPPSRPAQTLEDEASQIRESHPKPILGKPIPTIEGVQISAEEVISAFELNGAENIVKKPCGKLADAMIIATGRSSMHARMLAELIVKASKERRLKMFNPSKPIEGETDWFLVDTGRLLVHIFGDNENRQRVGLEDHLDDLARRRDEIRSKLGAILHDEADEQEEGKSK